MYLYPPETMIDFLKTVFQLPANNPFTGRSGYNTPFGNASQCNGQGVVAERYPKLTGKPKKPVPTFRSKILGFLAALLVIGPFLYAQEKEVIFQVNLSKEKLGVNERLRVEFSMNKDGDNFNPPSFKGFKVAMGPSQSVSSSWVNGVRSFSKTYSYILVPTARGQFTIGQATIDIEGNQYKTLPQTVVVTTSVDHPNAPPTATDIANESLYLVAELSKTNPYLNEAVTVVYKLYVSPEISVTDYRPLDTPAYHNFWSQEIPITEYTPQNGTYRGRPYRYVILKKVVLYPQKSGKLNLEPLSLEVSADIPTNRRDFFGLRMYTPTSKTVTAGRRTLEVKPLPEPGKPANFNGAVGNFEFSVTVSKKQLNALESLQAKIEVSGAGNLKLFQLPEPELPGALEVYEPEYEEHIKTSSLGMQGKVANTYTIVPSFKGKYPVPGSSFSYFNPETEKYVTLHSKAITIEVLKGPTASTSIPPLGTTANQPPVIPQVKPFYFIKLTPNLKGIGTTYFLGSLPFYAVLFTLLALPFGIIFAFKKQAALAGDRVSRKIQRANRRAKKYLATAKKQLGDKDAFYIAMEKGLHNYLKAKLNLETSEFSKEKITKILQEKQVEKAAIQDFTALLNNCEIARYSPFSNVQMQNDYEKARTVISNVDKQL